MITHDMTDISSWFSQLMGIKEGKLAIIEERQVRELRGNSKAAKLYHGKRVPCSVVYLFPPGGYVGFN